MNLGWPEVPIGDAAIPVNRLEQPSPGMIYRQVGVRLWGEGAYERGPVDGGQTQYKTLNRTEEGDIIVNKIWARNGSVSVITKNSAGCYVSAEFPLFRPILTKLDPKWFYWITKTRWFWNYCDFQSRGTSGKNRIRPEKFLAIKIPLPPLEEQRRIVAKVERLAAKIEEAQELRRQADSELDALLIAMAHRADLDETAKRREGWNEVALGDVIRQVQDAHTVEPEANYPNFGIYSFGRGLFAKAPIQGIATSAKTLYRVHSGQFIYSRLFAFEGAYGMVSDEFDSCFISNEYPTFDCNNDLVSAEFLYAYFKSPAVWRKISAGSKGLGDRRQRVQPEEILAHRLMLPPLNWQNRIQSVMTEVSVLQRFQGETAAELDALLPSILDKAFKGEL